MRSLRRGFLRSSDLFWPLVLFLFSSRGGRESTLQASSLPKRDFLPFPPHLPPTHWSHETCRPRAST